MSITIETIAVGTAIIISMITLWLTHLQGASIGLVDIDPRNVEVVVDDKNKEHFPFVLRSKADPIVIYLMNGGNRAGYVKRVYAVLDLEPPLKDFCRVVETIGSFEPDHMMIKDKEIKEIKWSSVSICVDKIRFEDVDWRRFLSSLGHNKKLDETIDEMVEEKRKIFENFISVLEEITKLGHITIFYELTKRFRKLKSKQLDVVIEKEVVEKYKSLYKRIEEISKNAECKIADRLLRFIKDDMTKDIINLLVEYVRKDLEKSCESEPSIALDNVKKLVHIKQEEKFRFLCKFDKKMQTCDFLFDEIVRFYQDWDSVKGSDEKMRKEIITKYDLEKRRKKLLKDVDALLPKIKEFCASMSEECQKIIYLKE